MKVYWLEVLVIDHDNLGGDQIVDEISNVRFPNDCVRPRVLSWDAREIGPWRDDHPLNNSDTVDAEVTRLFDEG